jgi:CyaY protein
MDEKAFRDQADKALDLLFRFLTRASERYDFEADMNNGALTVEFEEPPAKFVVSPNSPVRQIWVSAHAKSFKLDWSEDRGTFYLAETGQTLIEVIVDQIAKQTGERIPL